MKLFFKVSIFVFALFLAVNAQSQFYAFKSAQCTPIPYIDYKAYIVCKTAVGAPEENDTYAVFDLYDDFRIAILRTQRLKEDLNAQGNGFLIMWIKTPKEVGAIKSSTSVYIKGVNASVSIMSSGIDYSYVTLTEYRMAGRWQSLFIDGIEVPIDPATQWAIENVMCHLMSL